MAGEVAAAGDVEEESGRGVLDALQFVEEFLGDAGVECVALVESPANECMGGCFWTRWGPT